MRVTYAVLAPAGTPRPAVDKLSNQFSRIVALPDLREKLAGQGMAPLYSTPEQLAAMMKSEMARFAQVIKTANLKFEP